MMTQENLRTRRQNMLQLWVLVAVFALPLIAGWLLHFNPQWLPQGRSNHGVLVEPPLNMQPFILQTAANQEFDWSSLEGQWTLTVLAEGVCDEQCMEQLVKVRQIRRALAAERQRVERLLIMLPDAAGKLTLPSMGGLEGTRLAIVTATDKPALQAAFATEQRQIENSLFIIDPRVDLMMAHDMSLITEKQILQDLERLLKASKSWVKGGRYGH